LATDALVQSIRALDLTVGIMHNQDGHLIWLRLEWAQVSRQGLKTLRISTVAIMITIKRPAPDIIEVGLVMDVLDIELVKEACGRLEILEVLGIGTIILPICLPPVVFGHAELVDEVPSIYCDDDRGQERESASIAKDMTSMIRERGR